MAEALIDNLYQPLKIGAKEGARLAEDLATKVKRAKADRSELEARWERAHKLFEGIRPAKTTPWVDAANTHIPLVSTHASAIHARFMTSAFGQEPVWTVKAKSPLFQDFAKAATEYMDWSARNEMGLYEAVRDAVWDAVKLNLGILKASWVREEGPIRKYQRGKDGKMRLVEQKGVIKNQPLVEAVAPHMFVWSPGATDIQTAEWVAQIHRLSPLQLRHLFKRSHFVQNRELILATAGYAVDDRIVVQIEKNEGIFASDREFVEIYEVWADTEVNGELVKVKAMVEPSLGVFAALQPNPVLNRRRPFAALRLECREHSITGLGVGDQIGDLNEEANTVHNQMIDATTVSICQMFAVRQGSPAWEALESGIYPAKRIPKVSDSDVSVIEVGPMKATSLPLEEYIRSYAERRTGISDFGLGREPSASRRGTATGTLAIIQEGNRKFDFQVSDMRRGMGEIGMTVLGMIQQVYPEGRQLEVLGPAGESFNMINVAFPEDTPLEEAVSVEVIANSAAVNRQVKRQDSISLFQIVMSLYAQSFQLAQQLAMPGQPPPLIEMGVQMAKGAKILMQDILESFENRQADEIIPDLEELYAQIGAIGFAQGFAQAAGLGGPAGAGAGAGGSPVEGGGGGGSAAPAGPIQGAGAGPPGGPGGL